MQPNDPYGSQPQPPVPQPQATIPPNQSDQPNYDFLYNQPQKNRRFPSLGNSLAGKIIVVLFCLILVVILIAIIKGIVTPQPFSKSAYQTIVERQQEILHILNTDVTQSNLSQLSQSDQNAATTTKASIYTAQGKTLLLMSDNGFKLSPKVYAGVFSHSVDQTLNSSLSSNTFDSTFKSTMLQQLNWYKQELKTAYNSTNISSGKSLLQSEYKEANLLIVSFNS